MSELIQATDQPGFDYQQLDSMTRDIIRLRTDKIKTLMRRTAQDIFDIGEMLIEAKTLLGHGHFGEWLKTEFEWTPMTAQRFMQVATQFKNNNLLDLNFAPSALYLLAAPSTPDEIRQDFVEQAQNGATVTYSNVKTALGIHKTINPLVAYGGLSSDAHLDEASPLACPKGRNDESKPVCPECGQVYDGDGCPDCGLKANGYNYKRDNRRSVAGDIYTPQGMDACQTPAYALDPLLPYLPREWVIWEPSCGEGLLVEALYDSGYSERQVKYGDILTGQNFFEYEPDNWDCLITNPPFSIQEKWLERCYQLGKPFALLLKVESLGNRGTQELIQHYGFEMLLLDQRVDFKMPYKGWDSSAQFPTFWLCWQLLPSKVVFGSIQEGKRQFKKFLGRVTPDAD